MFSEQSAKVQVFNKILDLLENKTVSVTDDMPLLGDERGLDSMRLVELCLALEDMATEFGCEFDWTSDSAMSRSRSMFRTAGSLATEFINQMKSNK